jgi:hypothetical protein
MVSFVPKYKLTFTPRTVLSSAGNDGNIRLWKAVYNGQWRSMGHIHTEHGDEEGADDMQE